MMRIVHAWILGLAMLGLPACSEQPSGAEAESGTRAERGSEKDIATVLSSLATPIRLEGEEPEALNLTDRMAFHKVPAVSVAYFDDGEIVWARAWGLDETKTGEPVTTETLFQASALSKPVATVGMLTMVEEGLLDLDTDIDQYLTSWSLPETELTDTQPVTLRLIASHSAGLTVGGFLGYPVGTPIPTMVQMLDGIPPANSGPVLVFTTPGTLFRYSGGGFLIMQLLMEELAGMPFPQLMRERVLDPLGMKESTFEQQLPAARLDQVAAGHDAHGELVNGRFHLYPEQAAAGLWSTPSDLARLILEVQRAFADETGRLLSRAMTREMLTAQIRNRGLGFGLLGTELVTALRERGSNTGYCAQWFAHRSGDGMVIMTNGANGCDLAREILMGVSQVYGWPEIRQQTRKVSELSEAVIAGYTGRYQITRPVNAEVIVEPTDGGLSIEVMGLAREKVYYPASKIKFFDRSGSKVKFEVGEDGRATAVLFGSVRAERVN